MEAVVEETVDYEAELTALETKYFAGDKLPPFPEDWQDTYNEYTRIDNLFADFNKIEAVANYTGTIDINPDDAVNEPVEMSLQTVIDMRQANVDKAQELLGRINNFDQTGEPEDVQARLESIETELTELGRNKGLAEQYSRAFIEHVNNNMPAIEEQHYVASTVSATNKTDISSITDAFKTATNAEDGSQLANIFDDMNKVRDLKGFFKDHDSYFRGKDAAEHIEVGNIAFLNRKEAVVITEVGDDYIEYNGQMQASDLPEGTVPEVGKTIPLGTTYDAGKGIDVPSDSIQITSINDGVIEYEARAEKSDINGIGGRPELLADIQEDIVNTPELVKAPAPGSTNV